MSVKFYHFTFAQLVVPEIWAKILSIYNKFFYKCKTECLIFRLERYLQKSKKLGGTIKHFNVPRFIPKNKTEKKDTNIN